METIDELAGRVLTICTRMSESAHRITRAQRDLAKAKSDHDGDLQELRECSSRLAVRLARIDKQETIPAFVPPGMQKSAQAQEESLTGNSLNRVFEEHPPLPEDIAKAEVSIANEKAVEACVAGFEQCAKNVRSQQSVGPVAGALHPFRELLPTEIIPMPSAPPYSQADVVNVVLARRRKQFDAWLKQHDLELIHGNRDWYLRSMSAQEAYEARNWVARRTEAGCGGIEAIRSAFDDLMLKRKGS